MKRLIRARGRNGGGNCQVKRLRGAGEERGDFDDGIGELAHGADEEFDKARVKLRSPQRSSFGKGLFRGAAFFVAAVAGDGVVGIGDGDDARAERNIFSRQCLRVSGSIEKFVMVQDHAADARERHQRLQQFSAEGYVGLHRVPLFQIQRAALIQDRFGDAHFADIVQDRAKANLFHFQFGHAQGFGQQRRVS